MSEKFAVGRVVCCCVYIVIAVSPSPPLMPYNRVVLYIVQFIGRQCSGLKIASLTCLVLSVCRLILVCSFVDSLSLYPGPPITPPLPVGRAIHVFFFFLLRRMSSFVLCFVVCCAPITSCFEWAARPCPSTALFLHSFAKKVNLRLDLLRLHSHLHGILHES